MTVRKVRTDHHGYDTDFAAWSAQQAALLRARRWSEINVGHVAEEIESLSRSDRRAARSLLQVVMLHLLKWQFQPDRRSRSWRSPIRTGRNQWDLLLEDSPSCGVNVSGASRRTYAKARLAAADETELPPAASPETCPWTAAQILDAAVLRSDARHAS